MSYNTLRYEVAENILTLTLNRPDQLNAFTIEMAHELIDAFNRASDDDEVRAVVVTGAGRAFCAGMDLKAAETGHKSTQEFMELMAAVPNVHWQALLRDDQPCKPIILAVEGYALAGGTEILQGTDLRVAAEDAIFGVTEVARGLYPQGGSTVRLRRQIPYCLAAEILLLGDHITAQQALDFGLINRIVPKGQALAEARKMAAQLCQNGPLAVKAVTTSLRRQQEDMAEAQAMLKSDELAYPVFASEDAKEGLRAFREKRPAVFKGK